ncbi:mechanosensitive ion channel family protein [Virgibacillus halodenitrificans]|uniref:mechanosensitive ion channel family protein n=1 Tax=Virgibacillus halodenitrificans TaxID=1482 RepID=UPI00045CA4FB|nr:mechanosensitive ion channel family protein [Virgibacillus halodenitrificans]CDQ37124.1 MscS family inner membrane protein YnaI [Virgibacillus halodenitrificans]
MSWESFYKYENIIQLSISVTILLLSFLLKKYLAKYVFLGLLKLGRGRLNGFFAQLRLSFERPIQVLIFITGIYISMHYFPYFSHSNPFFLHVIRSSVILMIGWGLFNLSSSSSTLFSKINEKYNMKIDNILIPLFSRALRFIIVAISISVIAQEFGYDINGFVAGLGIGGLAFALAAKDALANMFGGIIIITEKPFTIGDWILTPSVEGTVEDISFRSTKIRTFAQAVVTVPNATLSNEAITNWSKMGKRQIAFTLRVTYDTPREKIEKVVREVEELLRSHRDIHQETIFVNVDAYKENGIELFLYFFTKTTDWGKYLKIKEEVNLYILDLLEMEQVTLALPTRKLVMEESAYINPIAMEQKQEVRS